MGMIDGIVAVERIATLVPLGGFVLALVFGAVAQRSGFCTMGAISDLVLMGDGYRLRVWVLAIAVAIAGTQTLHLAGVVDLGRSMYAGPRLPWLSHLVGGACFGVGMTLASGCGARNLIRLGGGNLKSAVVLLVMAVCGYMTLKGLLAVPRTVWLDRWAVALPTAQDLPSILGEASRPWLAGLVPGGLALWCLADRGFRTSSFSILTAGPIGLLVAGGWALTGGIGFVPEHPETLEEVFVGTNSHRPESFTYVAPLAYGLELLMLWTDASLRVTFGIATMAGTVFGALGAALLTRRFRWEAFSSTGDLGRHLLGASLMGFGGVTALGCTVGQGISGISVLSVGALLTVAGIVVGCVGTLRVLEARA
jgi:uncharacterized membrane protein YedE/YeeE